MEGTCDGPAWESAATAGESASLRAFGSGSLYVGKRPANVDGVTDADVCELVKIPSEALAESCKMRTISQILNLQIKLRYLQMLRFSEVFFQKEHPEKNKRVWPKKFSLNRECSSKY